MYCALMKNLSGSLKMSSMCNLNRLFELVKRSGDEILNTLLEIEANLLSRAEYYERSPDSV